MSTSNIHFHVRYCSVLVAVILAWSVDSPPYRRDSTYDFRQFSGGRARLRSYLPAHGLCDAQSCCLGRAGLLHLQDYTSMLRQVQPRWCCRIFAHLSKIWRPSLRVLQHAGAEAQPRRTVLQGRDLDVDMLSQAIPGPTSPVKNVGNTLARPVSCCWPRITSTPYSALAESMHAESR